MQRATTIVRRPAVKADHVVDTLTLDHEARGRRRIVMTGENGTAFLLDLDRPGAIEDGDALRLDDGGLVQVLAAPERLVEVTANTPLRLMKVGWHIGNRHVAAEITEGAIFIAHDHVLMEMLRGLGAATREVHRPFRPERGAYEEHGGHAHESGHGGDHEGHGHGHGHGGAACGCGHDHHAHDHGSGAQAHSHAHRHAHDHGPSHAAGHGGGDDQHGPGAHDHRHG